MNSSYLPRVLIIIILLVGGGCTQVSVSKRIDVSTYLKEAKECYLGERVRDSDGIALSDELKKKLKRIEIDDYVDERLLKSGELLIQFQKSNGETYSIELEVDLNKSKSCQRISVYEIVS